MVILENLCVTESADYNSLCKKTGRSRTTLIQSINSLAKNGYIETQKVNPEREKSKVTFKLTYKGKSHAWNIGVDAENVLRIEGNSAVNNYVQLLKELPSLPRRYMFHHLALHFLQRYGWMEDDDDEYKKTLKESFQDGLMDSVGDEDYDSRNIFTPKIRNWLERIYSSEELKDLKEELYNIRNNINSTIERLPV